MQLLFWMSASFIVGWIMCHICEAEHYRKKLDKIKDVLVKIRDDYQIGNK